MYRCSISILIVLAFSLGLIFTGCTEDGDLTIVGPRENPSEDARLTILAIYDAAREYRNDTGEFPLSLEMLIDKGYIVIDESIAREWRFFIILTGEGNRHREIEIIYIEAVSTSEMRGGSGHKVLFDVANWSFYGYGIHEVSLGDVKSNLLAVVDAFNRFTVDHNCEPASVNELVESGYVSIDEAVERAWTFSFVGNNPAGFITAIASNQSEDEYWHLVYFPQTGVICDYLIDDFAWEPAHFIGEIISAAGRYHIDEGDDPSSVEELIEEGYLIIDEGIERRWSFTLIGSNPITQLEAVSTRDHWSIGAGHVVLFDVESGQFSGYEFTYVPQL